MSRRMQVGLAAAGRAAKAVFCWLWTQTDKTTKWLQLVALIVAAWWSINVFENTQASAVDIPPAMYMDPGNPLSKWTPGGACTLSLAVGIRNIGLKIFELDRVHIRIWFQDLKLNSGLNPVNREKLQTEGSLICEEWPITPLVNRFPPKADLHDGFVWIYSGAQPFGWYLVRADAEDGNHQSLAFAYWLSDHWYG